MSSSSTSPDVPTKEVTKSSSSTSSAPLRAVDFLNVVAFVLSSAACVAFHVYKPFSLESSDVFHSLKIAAVSFAACTVMMFLCPRSLSFENRSRVVSTVHAVVSTYLSFMAICEMKDDPRFKLSSWLDFSFLGSASQHSATRLESLWMTRYPVSHFAVAVTWGYICYDSSLLLVDPKILDWAMRIHHAVAIFGFGSSLWTGFATPYMAFVLMNEASTPFVNNHYTWAKSGLARSLNGAMMWLSYAFFRLVVNSTALVHIVTTATEHVRTAFPKSFWGYLAGFLAVQGECSRFRCSLASLFFL